MHERAIEDASDKIVFVVMVSYIAMHGSIHLRSPFFVLLDHRWFRSIGLKAENYASHKLSVLVVSTVVSRLHT
jgi:hypothetical protein